MSTKTFWSALMSAATVMLCGCATPPSLQSAPPSTSPGSGYMLHRSALLDVTDHMTKHLDNDKSIVYFQKFGGGGAGVGLLLGPLGVMANVSMIGSNTTKDAAQLKDRVAINPREIFAQAAARAGVDLSEDPHKLRVTPYMLVSKTEGEVLLTSVAVIVESGGTAEPKKWSGRYVVQLPHQFTIGALAIMDEAALQNLKTGACWGFAKVLGRLMAERDVAISKEPAIKLKSDLIAPRFGFELLGSLVAEEEEGLVWVRTVGGVFGVQRTNLQYTRQQVQSVAGSPAAAR